MILTMYLSLLDCPQGQAIHGIGDLWVRRVETDAVPRPPDQVVLWPTEEEGPGGGPLWDTRRHYMHSDGSWHVELARMAIDPSEVARDVIARSQEWRVWWTENDGDPRPMLRSGGWRLYGDGGTGNA